MHLQNSFRWITTACVGAGGALGMLLTPNAAIAQGFEQAEIEDSSQIVLATSPAGQVGYQLLIVEQLTDERPCWESYGAVIEPLLLEFDFSGICRRILDSNGYSLRMGNEDLGLDYTLRIVPKGNYLALVASSTRDYFAPSIEVGRTAPGQTDSFAAIYLAPGWRLTRRAFEGQTLGHYYITNDMDVDSYMSIAVLSDDNDTLVAPMNYTFPATPSAPVAPTTPPSIPVTPSPQQVVPPLPATPAPNTTVVPTLTAPVQPGVLTPAPTPPAAQPVPNTTVVPTLTVPVQPGVLTPAPTPSVVQPSVPAPIPSAPPVQPNLSTPVPTPQPSLPTPPPSNSPIPNVEASPTMIPPLAPLPEADVSPLLVPSPPPVSQDEAPDANAASGVEPSPWIEFDRQPSNVQTF